MSYKSLDNWTRLQLGKVATLQRGFDLPVQNRQGGKTPVYGSNGIDGYHNKFAVKGPGVITGRSGSIGSVFYEVDDYWPLNTSLYVNDFHGNNRKFVARLLESLNLKNFSASTGVPSLNRNFIHPLIVCRPPVAEQSAIAAILDTMDEAIRQTEAVIAKLRQVKAGMLHDLLTRGLDENGELRDPLLHPEQFKDSPLGWIPVEWDMCAIDEIATHVGSGATPTGGGDVYTKEGVLFIRSQNVSFDGLLLEEVAYIPEKIHTIMKHSEIFENDVLLNITGASLGRCCVFSGWKGEANVNQHVCAIRLTECNKGRSNFLASYFASNGGQTQIFRFNAGSNREGLNFKQIRSIKLPWPKKQIEFDEIGRSLSGIKRQVLAEQQQLAKLKILKQGLMHDLLTGTVRVPPNLLEATP